MAIIIIIHIFSKAQVGPNKKGTQFPTPFLGTVFHAPSHGVIHFVRSVSFKNLEMEVYDWLLKNVNQMLNSVDYSAPYGQYRTPRE